jgi:hypothetical protein
LNLKELQVKILEEVYKEYFRDGCREFDAKIYKREFNESEKKAAKFDLASYLKDLRELADVPNENFTHKRTKFGIVQTLSLHYDYSIQDPKVFEGLHNKYGRPKGEIVSVNNAPTLANGGTGAPATYQQGLRTGGDAQAQNGGQSFTFPSQGGTSIGGDSELPNFRLSRAQSVGQFVTPKASGNQKTSKGPMNLPAMTDGSNGSKQTQPNNQWPIPGRESPTDFLDFSANRQESTAQIDFDFEPCPKIHDAFQKPELAGFGRQKKPEPVLGAREPCDTNQLAAMVQKKLKIDDNEPSLVQSHGQATPGSYSRENSTHDMVTETLPGFGWIDSHTNNPKTRTQLKNLLIKLASEKNFIIEDLDSNDEESILIEFRLVEKPGFGSLKLRLYLDEDNEDDHIVEVHSCILMKVMKLYLNKNSSKSFYEKIEHCAHWWVETSQQK